MHRAGWRVAADLNVPTTSRRSAGPAPTSLLPPYSPELNAIERVWLYLRERFLSHRVWRSYADILDACCQAWNASSTRPAASARFARSTGPCRSELNVGGIVLAGSRASPGRGRRRHATRGHARGWVSSHPAPRSQWRPNKESDQRVRFPLLRPRSGPNHHNARSSACRAAG